MKNVGKAILRDLQLLGITSINQLKNKTPDQLLSQLQKIIHTLHDPCVWDVFAAIIHEAQTGEKLSWWHFTKIRKSKINNSSPSKKRPRLP